MSDGTQFSAPAPGSTLIAQAGDPSSTAGARALDSFTAVGNDLAAIGSDEFSATALGMDGLTAGLDMLAFVANPFKEFLMAGVGFIIEHVDWLREPLEDLTGDPAEISALSKTWANIAQEINDAAGQFQSELEGTADWEGDAADAYRSVAGDFSQALGGAAAAAQGTSQGIAYAGVLVATVKALVLELLCDFTARVIMYLLSALASSWFTFGGSVVAAIGTVVADAGAVAARIGKKLSELLQSAATFVRKFGDAGSAFGTFASKLDEAAIKMWGKSGRLDLAAWGKGSRMDIKGWGIDNLAPGRESRHSARDAFDNFKSSYDDMADWGKDPLTGATTGLRNIADTAGGYPATGLRGYMAGVKEEENSTTPEA
ncbi:WXG100 family type VII secretion target [Glycomyces tarimensis]